MRQARVWMVVALCAALAGCETLSEDQCRKADWLLIGQKDGNDGRNDRWIDAHRRACSKVNIVPDERIWLRGWAEGVRNFCTPRRAWRLGLADSTYSGACRDHGESVFLRYYEAGRAAYKTRKERESVEREIGKAEEELKKADKDDVRKTLRDKIRRLDDEHARLGRQLERQMREEPR